MCGAAPTKKPKFLQKYETVLDLHGKFVHHKDAETYTENESQDSEITVDHCKTSPWPPGGSRGPCQKLQALRRTAAAAAAAAAAASDGASTTLDCVGTWY